MSDKNIIKCSFCNKNRDEVDTLLEGPLVADIQVYICNECIDVSHQMLHVEANDPKPKKVKIKIPTPDEIKSHLDEYIIGQDDCKVTLAVAVYNHYKRIHNKSNVIIDKSNVLMIGASGSGKTLSVKNIAKLFDLPYIIVDATTLTEAGYVGDNVTNIIKRLIQESGDNIERAQKGIIFIDEIDKKSRSSDTTIHRDVSGEGVQQALLKLIEGTIVKIEDEFGLDIADFDTSNILFICSGAFIGLDAIIKKRISKEGIGFGSSLKTTESFSKIVKNIQSEDLIKYGLIPEFVGRCPVTSVFDDLDIDIIKRILTEPKNCIIEQFKELFKFEHVRLSFDDKYIHNVAEKCLAQKNRRPWTKIHNRKRSGIIAICFAQFSQIRCEVYYGIR